MRLIQECLRIKNVVISLIFSLGVASCGTITDLQPPGVPTGLQLANYYENDFDPGYKAGVTPRETLVVGIAYVDQKCSDFFDAVEEMNRKLAVGESVFLTAANQTQTLMTLAKKSAFSIAKVAAAVEVTKVLLEQYQKEFTFAPHSVELRAIINQAMDAQRSELGTILSQSGIRTHYEVVAAIKTYAQNCTLANIHEQWNRAIAKAVREGVAPDSTPKRGAIPPPPAESNYRRRATRVSPTNVLGINKYVVK